MTTNCLINQPTCGLVAGNPVCPKCGMDERVVYPGEADREAAQSAAQKRFEAVQREVKDVNLDAFIPTTSSRGAPEQVSGATVQFDVFKALGGATALALLVGVMWWKQQKEDEVRQGEDRTAEAVQQHKADSTSSMEYRIRHILVEGEAEANSIIAAIQTGSRFEDLAKAHSKDPGSRTLGGDLGWADPAIFVVEFERAVRALDKGQVSRNPVQTVFGWHVIRVDHVRQVERPGSKK